MYNNDGILIKGNRDGINTTINMNKFSSFEDMSKLLIKKLSKGKKFYQGTTLILKIDLNLLNEKNFEELKEALLTEIGLKDIVFEDLEKETVKSTGQREEKVFTGVYEGKTKFIRKTVRSGQSINYRGNIVIIGDINSGAEVYATGNVVVLGRVRGKVSAGTNGNNKAIIAAFLLQPEMLKISNVIAMSPDDVEKPNYPELAKVKDGVIIVEPYLPNKYIY
ncbi:septum site-determining protein MinC [uncultured Clostridium sp.]|uniref:septum site-determining protein MinC n=1 Tax=uncultured Clostridium sp. TaxID=59620 RepID=UPI0025EAF79E|nr:septum site-determining protein MinC [uncultured Clostridium sp.]